MENDLETMNKKMPYTVPEGFFEEMEECLVKEVATKKKSRKLRNAALWTGFAVAASLALLIVLRQVWHNTDEESFRQVEMAFNQLSEGDQELMLEYYDEIDYLDNN